MIVSRKELTFLITSILRRTEGLPIISAYLGHVSDGRTTHKKKNLIFINAYRLCDIHKLGLSLANQARAGAVWHRRNLGIIDMEVQLPDTIIDIFLKKINFSIICRGVEYYTVYLDDGTMAMTRAVFLVNG